ncbi:MAG: alpha/beta hydrolase [Woeseiaceae bacterium]
MPGLICSDYVWSPQARDLESYGVTAVPGYGAAASIAAMARSVLDIMPERVALAGHSMGARVALEIFRMAPERVERIALLDTGVHPRQPGERDKRMRLLQTGKQHGMQALVDEWLPPMVHPQRRQDADFMAPLYQMAVDAGVDQFERQVEALLARPDAAPLLAKIRCPALVGVGRQDEWSPVAQHEAIAAAIPDADLVIFEDAAHMAPLEAPEQVSKALINWLEK